MKDSKLVEILTTFSKEELKSFEKFIRSPYFSIGRDVTGLFSILKKSYPQFESKTIDRKKVFSTLYPGEIFSEKKHKNIVFDLTRLAEQFLVHDLIKSDAILRDKLLSYQYRRRNQDRYLLNTLDSLEKKIDELLIDRSKFYQSKEDLSYLKEDYYFWKIDLQNSVKFRLDNAEYFSLFFLVRTLQRMKDKIIITSRTPFDFSNSLFDSVTECFDLPKLIELLKKKNYKYSWLIEIYYYSYMCQCSDDENNYWQFKEIFKQHVNEFTDEEKNILFLDLTYYCSRMNEIGKSEFLREGFEVYTEMLKHSSYSEKQNRYLHIEVFRNIVLACLNLKEYDWLEKFSEKYIPKLKLEFRNSMDFYIKANLCFARRQFNEALEYISKIKYDIFLYKFDIKNLMLRIYYELELYHQAYSLIDAYKHFLNENKEHAGVHKKRYGNFLKYYSKLLRAKEKSEYEAAGLLKNELKNTVNTSFSNWLLEKTDELIKSGRTSKKLKPLAG